MDPAVQVSIVTAIAAIVVAGITLAGAVLGALFGRKATLDAVEKSNQHALKLKQLDSDERRRAHGEDAARELLRMIDEAAHEFDWRIDDSTTFEQIEAQAHSGPSQATMQPHYEEIRRKALELTDPIARESAQMVASLFYWPGEAAESLNDPEWTIRRIGFETAKQGREIVSAFLRGETGLVIPPELSGLHAAMQATLDHIEEQIQEQARKGRPSE
jgi:hypothetical protein